MSDYGQNEWAIIKAFGFQSLAKVVDNPISIYEMMVRHAFINDMKGSHVEALRRTYSAIQKCKPYRMTPEFEQLAYFE